jgi:Flp pilus assembly secretin CpaC
VSLSPGQTRRIQLPHKLVLLKVTDPKIADIVGPQATAFRIVGLLPGTTQVSVRVTTGRWYRFQVLVKKP